jgi:hypothetical protein
LIQSLLPVNNDLLLLLQSLHNADRNFQHISNNICGRESKPLG